MQKKNLRIFLIFLVIIVAIAGYEAVLLNLSAKENKSLKRQLSQMSNEIARLQSQLKLAEGMVNPLKEEIISLTKSLEKKEGLIIELRRQAAQAQDEVQKLKQEFSDTQAGITELNNELNKVTKDFDRLKEMSATLLDRLSGGEKKKAEELKAKVEVILKSLSPEAEKATGE